jgi:arylsulfatase A-like enzyme
LVRLVDLAPTLLGLLDLPPLPGAQGIDFSDFVRGGAPLRDAVFTDGRYEGEEGRGSSVVADIEGRRWSYVARVRDTRAAGAGGFAVAGAAELYDLDQDPYQQRDVSAQEPQLERQLRNRLLAWYSANALRARRQGAARQRAFLAPAEIEYLRAVGYAQ